MNGPSNRAALRAITIGGQRPEELLAALQRAKMQLNDAARQLLADSRFPTSAVASTVILQEVGVAELGCAEGAVFAELVQRASERGFMVCPLELAPHLRLQFPDQAEGAAGQPATQHCAPHGSLTVISSPLDESDPTIPRGFYLRRIHGELWLRGYWASPDDSWAPHDRLILRVMESME